MRAIIILAAVAALAGGGAARGQGVATLPGWCPEVTVGATVYDCVGRGMIYSEHPNRRMMFSVVLNDDRALSFVGDQHSEPTPGNIILLVQRVRFGTPNRSMMSDAGGVCRARGDHQRGIVHEVTCEATDGAGTRYALRFLGSGEPMAVMPRGPSASPPGGSAPSRR